MFQTSQQQYRDRQFLTQNYQNDRVINIKQINVPIDTQKIQHHEEHYLYFNQQSLIIKSQHKRQYQDYFKDVEQETDILINQALTNFQARIDHRIVFLNENKEIYDLVSFKKPVVYVMGHQYGGTVIKYQVIIGNYKISLDLLNLNLNGPTNLKEIGKGGYGQICILSYDDNKLIVAKRLKFYQYYKIFLSEVDEQILANKSQIQQAICEYAIYKICSFYKIGPKVVSSFGFDLVCFEDCIQFYIEYCEMIQCVDLKLEKELKTALRLLHKLKIVHKDVKSMNLLYSYEYQKYVLIDFGISHPVEQSIGELTSTYKQGSYGYMCQQMSDIKQGQCAHIDLYFNDLYGLKKSLEELKNYLKKQVAHKMKYKNQSIVNFGKKINLYAAIHLLYYFINNKVSENLSFIKELIERRFHEVSLLFNNIINQQISNFIIQNIQLFPSDRRDYILGIKRMESWQQEKRKLYYLIRCFGFSDLLKYELKSFKETNLITSLTNKIQGSSDRDYQFYQNFYKLNKINPLEFKIEQQIKQLQSITTIQQDDHLLLLYYQLIVFKLRRFHLFFKEIRYLSKKLVEAYKYRNEDYRLEIIKSVNNIMQHNFEKQNNKVIKRFIKSYPQKQQQLYQLLVIMYGSTQNGIRYYEKLLDIHRSHKSKYNCHQIYEILSTITNYYYLNNNNGKFNQYFNQFQLLIRERISKQNILQSSQSIKIYKYIGNIEVIKANYKQALRCYEISQLMQKKYNGEFTINNASIIFHIGYSYFMLTEYEQAVSYIKQALKILKIFSTQFTEYYVQVDLCYYYLCMIYLIRCNQQLFQQYLNLYSFEWIATRCQMILPSQFLDKLPQRNTKLLKIDQIIKYFKIDKNKDLMTQQKCNEYQNIFKNIFYEIFYKRSSALRTAREKYQDLNNAHILNKSQQEIQITLIYLKQLYLLILPEFISLHKQNICCQDKCLEFESFYYNLKCDNINMLFQLYKLIETRFHTFENLQLCYQYLLKQRNIVSSISESEYIICFTKLSYVSVNILKYHHSIYYAQVLLSDSKLSIRQDQKLSLCLSLQISLIRLKKFKELKKYQVNNLKKSNSWDIECYTKLLELYNQICSIDNFLLIKCYVQNLMKINLKIFQVNLHFNVSEIQQNQKICVLMFLQNIKLTQNISQSILFRLIKFCKRCLLIKLKIGCLKYVKKKNLRRQILKASKLLR